MLEGLLVAGESTGPWRGGAKLNESATTYSGRTNWESIQLYNWTNRKWQAFRWVWHPISLHRVSKKLYQIFNNQSDLAQFFFLETRCTYSPLMRETMLISWRKQRLEENQTITVLRSKFAEKRGSPGWNVC